MADGKQRKEVYYSGQVQGVGFRYTARQIASRFDVAGFVRNLPDGRVHLAVEGRDAELTQYLREVESAFAHQITNIHIEDGAATGQLSGFEVRF